MTDFITGRYRKQTEATIPEHGDGQIGVAFKDGSYDVCRDIYPHGDGEFQCVVGFEEDQGRQLGNKRYEWDDVERFTGMTISELSEGTLRDLYPFHLNEMD